MSTYLSPLKIGLSAAYTCLKVWFDPAMSGSPYESQPQKREKSRSQKYPFFIKKLSIRI